MQKFIQRLLLFGILCLFIEQSKGQPPLLYSSMRKLGSCPPARITSQCSIDCKVDMDCDEDKKCCSTKCGAACTSPVTETIGMYSVKSGSCPREPKGAWVCSNRCTKDIDCRGEFKCCRNRCGALACTPPDFY